jgi:microcystin-dependent protein
VAEPFLGELRLMSFDFPPKGWALCNGQQLPINQNQALFALLGTMYGGNGQTTFALPELRGRVPMHVGSSFSTQGQRGGEEAHTLTQSEMPSHNHIWGATSSAPNQPQPGILAGGNNMYTTFQNPTTLRPDTVTNVGGSQPHENRHPFSVLSWCIALQGIFPSRN